MPSKQPRITVRLKDGSFEPVSLYDAEALTSCVNNQMFDLVFVSERSPQHHKLYWSVLNKVCKATGKWPTGEHLHRDLKIACGYYTVAASEFGGVYYLPDTTAMYKMSQTEFTEYFDIAMEKLAEVIGYDPLHR